MIVTLYQPKFSQCWLKTLINSMKGTFFLTGYKFSLGFKRFEKKIQDRSFALLTSTALGGSTGSDQPVTFLNKIEAALCITQKGNFQASLESGAF